jgi:hypothetical protein
MDMTTIAYLLMGIILGTVVGQFISLGFRGRRAK